ncbi:MAG: GTPase domain-containing protein, partial [Myxococcales bacterium]|nr:GTPase domain-containing protein [Myxococcales bacterium]
MQINLAQRELTLKLVYYGPALSGKTTNLRALHALAPPAGVGRLMNLETRDDRTLFFDLLPMFVRTGSGLKVKLKLYTVPGQVIHESTRRVVLQQADGVVFVADSQVAETEANQEAFAGLRRNMKAVELPKALPLVVQFNKRDL